MNKIINDYIENDCRITYNLYQSRKAYARKERLAKMCSTLAYVVIACAIVSMLAVIYFRPFLLWLVLVVTVFVNIGIATYLLFRLRRV